MGQGRVKRQKIKAWLQCSLGPSSPTSVYPPHAPTCLHNEACLSLSPATAAGADAGSPLREHRAGSVI